MVLRNIYQRGKECEKCHISFEYAEKMLAERQGTLEYSLRNYPRQLAAFASMQFENVSWIVAINAPYDEISAFVRKDLIETLLLMGLVVIALVGGLTVMYWNCRLKVKAEEETKRWREKRDLEGKIRQSEERYRRLVELSPDAIIIHSEGKIVFVNAAGAKILGASKPDELIGKPVLDIVHPDYREIAEERIRQGREEGRKVPMIEEKLVRLDGTEVEVEEVAIPFSYQGKPAVQAVVRDITERKRAKLALRESEEKYRSLTNEVLDSSAVGMFILDSDFKVAWMNQSLERYFGIRREDVIGHDKLDLIHEIKGIFEEPDSFAEWVLATYDNNIDIENFECHVLPGDGREERWLEHWSQPIRSGLYSRGRIEHYYDITERKRAEEEKEKMQTQLILAQKMEAVGILAGGVAHDFNNLLTAITGYSELLLNRIGEEDTKRTDIEAIRNAGERAASLTHQLLAFSRSQVLQPQMLDLNAVLTGMNEMLRRFIGEDIELEMLLQPQLPRIKADRGRIEQVIMNLTVNARDTMPGSGKLTIKTEQVHLDEGCCKTNGCARPGTFVCLSVEDSGVGMDKEIVQRIFEPFFSTKESGKGSGLGLSVVYGIVKQHEGWIDVTSEPGKGSLFRIYLQAFSEKAQAEARDAISLTELHGNGERILLVEDEEIVREFAKKVLCENGYVVSEAEDADAALDIFERERGRFDLVFSDVVLPGKSGLQLIDELLSRKGELAILLSSGYPDRKSQWPIIRERGFRFLQKPYNLADLLQAIREAMKAT